VASITTDSRLPAGWVRYSYGALSVGAPRGWTVYNFIPLCPSGPGTGVDEFTETTRMGASCGRPYNGISTVIALGCLEGIAVGQFERGSPSDSTRVDGRLLYRSSIQVSLRGSGWEATCFLLYGFSPPGLGREILGTVEPTGRSC
jgi:hypothetical protein